MHKTDLIEKVANECSVSKALAATVVETVLQKIQRALSYGDTVTLTGFGTFTPKVSKEKQGVAFGKDYYRAEKTRVTFKAGKALDEAVNPPKVNIRNWV